MPQATQDHSIVRKVSEAHCLSLHHSELPKAYYYREFYRMSYLTHFTVCKDKNIIPQKQLAVVKKFPYPPYHLTAYFHTPPLGSGGRMGHTSLPSRVYYIYNIFIYKFNYNIYIAPIGMNWRKPTHPTIPPPRRDVACYVSNIPADDPN